jgi:lipoprotein-releasing system permease protein
MRQWIDKQRHILDFTLSSLWRRKGRNLALITVYTAIVCALSSVLFFAQALKKEASLILKDTPEIIVQRIVAGRHDLIPLSYAPKISKIRGVTDVQGRLWGYYYDPLVQANYTLMVTEDAKEQNILVGHDLAQVRRLVKGSRMIFQTYDGRPLSLRINGILAPETGLMAADLILIGETDFRRLFGIAGEHATDLTLKVANRQEIPTIATKITQIFPDARPISRDEILRTYTSVFDWRGGFGLLMLAGALLAFIIFAWDKAAGISAEEKREIGILKAIGWETGDVLQMKFWEGLTVSLSAFLLGVILAYVHVFLIPTTLLEPALKGWSVLYPKFNLTPFISFFQIAVLGFLTVIPYLVATIIPTWRSATIDPDTVMRT